MSKALMRAKKKQQNKEEEVASPNKSDKVANLVKQLESNMQRRGENPGENTSNTEKVVVQSEVVDLLEKQTLTKSMKKKKPEKRAIDFHE